MAVVDADGRFTGLIPPHRMLAVLLAEHDGDLARLGGYLAKAEGARTAAEETVARRLRHRLPWLLLGLLGALGSAGIVGAFEDQLDETVLIAFFLPAVVYLADTVGTQTEAILIRGLSVGVRMRQVARRELLSGAVIRLLLGGAFLPFALAVWGDAEVAAAVALALVASCSIATVIQDLLSIMVYLVIATALAG